MSSTDIMSKSKKLKFCVLDKEAHHKRKKARKMSMISNFQTLPDEIVRHIIGYLRPVYPYMHQIKKHLSSSRVSPSRVKLYNFFGDTRPVKPCLNPYCSKMKTYEDSYDIHIYMEDADVENMYEIKEIHPLTLCKDCFDAFANKHLCFMNLDIYNHNWFSLDYDYHDYKSEFYSSLRLDYY